MNNDIQTLVKAHREHVESLMNKARQHQIEQLDVWLKIVFRANHYAEAHPFCPECDSRDITFIADCDKCGADHYECMDCGELTFL